MLDVLEAIEQIEKYAAGGRAEFDANELVRTWIVHHILIIGEASRGVSSDFRDRHPEIPWHEIVGMRNVLVHQYFGIDREIVWSVVAEKLPQLKQSVQAILDAR
jgi:uncharacterized protein with HEPN domain